MSPYELARLCADAAYEKKAANITILPVGEVLSIAEYFVICSAPNDRLVKAITDSILDQTRAESMKPIGVEGEREAEWVLIDYGSVVIHVFLEEAREFYRLERLFKDVVSEMWGDHGQEGSKKTAG